MAVGKAKVELFVIGNGAADEVVNGETPVPLDAPVAEHEVVVSKVGPTVELGKSGVSVGEVLRGPPVPVEIPVGPPVPVVPLL